MKPTAKPTASLAPLLAFGAHPDDIEFGCGGIVAREARAGRRVHFVVCSRGESASRGTPAQRTREARKAARLLGATIEFIALDGDAELEVKPAHAMKLASIIRRIRPGLVLAPSLAANQHPDHPRLGQLVRDASRLARYGGVKKLLSRPAHAIGPLLYYAVSDEAEPPNTLPVVVDISTPQDIAAWKASMAAHASQLTSRNYVELQLARARVLGLRSGVDYAQALFPNDPLVFDSLAPLTRASRRF
jgi:LmbE family N-acetylglucosaminyl deacetylase